MRNELHAIAMRYCSCDRDEMNNEKKSNQGKRA